MAWEPVTNPEGKKGFYDASSGTFIDVGQMQKVTNPEGKRGYWHPSTDFIVAPEGDTKQPAPIDMHKGEDGTWSPYIEGLKHGLKMSGLGGLQAVLKGGEWIRNQVGMESNQPNVNKVQQWIDEERQKYAATPKEGGIPFMLGGKERFRVGAGAGELTGGTLPYMAMPGGAEEAFIHRLIASMVQGGTIGALQPTSEGESRLANTGIGAVTGGAGQSVVSGGGKVINALRGKELPASEISDLSNKYGIRTTLGEVTKNPNIERAETWLEVLPIVGLKGFRDKQQKEASTAAKEYLGKFMADPSLTFGSPEAMTANRQYASGLFEDLKKILPPKWADNLVPLSPKNSQTAINDAVKRYPKLFTEFEDTERQAILTKIQNGENLNFDELWQVRASVGDMVGMAKKKFERGELDQTKLANVKRLYSSINSDIENWTTQIGRPDIKNGIRAANDAYKTYVVKYDTLDRAMAFMQQAETKGEPFSPQKFANALAKISNKNKYTDRFTKDEIQEMSGLANIMHAVRRAGQYGEHPATGHRWGALSIFGGMESAAYIGGNLLKPGGGEEMMFETAGAMATVAALTRLLVGTETGKAISLSASKIKPDSPAMQKIVNELYKILPRAGAVEAVMPRGDPLGLRRQTE
ncbi:MAG: hypothetical protein ACLP9S_13835 [Syntrophales bacterium]